MEPVCEQEVTGSIPFGSTQPARRRELPGCRGEPTASRWRELRDCNLHAVLGCERDPAQNDRVGVIA